jgi:hypothetical protein
VALASFVVAPQARLNSARNGSIRGRVELRKVPPPIEHRPGVSEVASAAMHDMTDRVRSVV